MGVGTTIIDPLFNKLMWLRLWSKHFAVYSFFDTVGSCGWLQVPVNEPVASRECAKKRSTRCGLVESDPAVHSRSLCCGLFTALYFSVGVERRTQRIASDLDASAKRRDQGGGETGSEHPPPPPPERSLFLVFETSS